MGKGVEDELWEAAFATLTCLTTSDIGDIEPFGFNDGISQPVLDWERKKSARIHDTTAYTNLSALGEVLLGYPNEYGKYTDRPLLDPGDDPDGILPLAEDVPGKKDLGRNGTYLVLRDLSQEAPAFWQFINEQAARDREDRDKVAAATVGRVPSDIPIIPSDKNLVPGDKPKRTIPPGAPIVPLSGDAIPGVGPDPEDIRRNQFTFHSDVDGTACPYGAHIRRANPRNADLPEGTRGLFARLIRILGFGRQQSARRPDCVDAVSSHSAPRPRVRARNGRRGWRSRACNGGCVSSASMPTSRGSSNSSRRPGSPIRNSKVSTRAIRWSAIACRSRPARPSDTFTRPQPSGLCRRSAALPQFVHVRGGAYFFMPGLRAALPGGSLRRDRTQSTQSPQNRRRTSSSASFEYRQSALP